MSVFSANTESVDGICRIGYVPISLKDPAYLEAVERERELGMERCRCSSCDPEGCALVLRLLPSTKAVDLDALLKRTPDSKEDVTVFALPKKAVKRKFTAAIPLVCQPEDPIRLEPAMANLRDRLNGQLTSLFNKTYPNGCHLQMNHLFTEDDAWEVVKNYEALENGVFMREILGGETLPGLFACIKECISSWKRTDLYKERQERLDDIVIEREQEILDAEILLAEHAELVRQKREARAEKDAGVAARRVARLAKNAAAELVKSAKREARKAALEAKVRVFLFYNARSFASASIS